VTPAESSPDTPTVKPIESSARFSTDVYDLDTVKRAAYRLTDRCAIDLRIAHSEIICTIRPLANGDTDLPRLVAALINEVLDQDLRRTISAETASIRNVILAYAFSKTGLQDDE
jgi:His-Xaa-Ser system protein HxsD